MFELFLATGPCSGRYGMDTHSGRATMVPLALDDKETALYLAGETVDRGLWRLDCHQELDVQAFDAQTRDHCARKTPYRTVSPLRSQEDGHVSPTAECEDLLLSNLRESTSNIQ